jgi:hypothetical protein
MPPEVKVARSLVLVSPEKGQNQQKENDRKVNLLTMKIVGNIFGALRNN